MKSFSKQARKNRLAVFLWLMTFTMVTIFSKSVNAISLVAVYKAACQRDIGLVLSSSTNDMYFLSIESGVKKVKRHEIIYLAEYPLDQLPGVDNLTITDVPMLKVMTLNSAKQKTELASGWPIGFTRDKISMLRSNGQEIVIDIKNIWSLTEVSGPHRLTTRVKPEAFNFVHPYAFKDCPVTPGVKSQTVYPQQILSEPVAIKRVMDEQMLGFNRVKRYQREQDFYAVPQIYDNSTELGIWIHKTSRYGASVARNNNFLPVLVDRYSSDIFDYQHVSVTGTAPILGGVHDEPQSQVSFGFKASYFHLNLMTDAQMLLLGEKYMWKTADFELGKAGDRVNDKNIVELGLDFWALSLKIYALSDLNLGFFDGVKSYDLPMNLPRLGLEYRDQFFRIEGNFGSGKAEDNFGKSGAAGQTKYDLRFARVNIELNELFLKTRFIYSFISREFTLRGGIDYSNRSQTHVVTARYPFTKRITLGGMLSTEALAFSSSLKTESDVRLFKFGGFASVSF